MSSAPRAETRRPLRPKLFHILLALSDGERHGYAIKKEVEQTTEGTVRMGPGTLYEGIQRLEKMALIRAVECTPAGEKEHSQRRYYRLTATGHGVLRDEVRRLERVLELARSRRLLTSKVR